MNDCERVIRTALEGTLVEYDIRQEEGMCVVVTPFEHYNGDLIRLYIRRNQGDYLQIRDYGETSAMLRLYGVNPASPAREDRIEHIYDRFNVEPGLGEVKLRAQEDNLGTRLQDAIQAVQAISYNIYTHTSRQPSRFRTQVETFLNDVGYDYNVGYKVQGETQPREFDFSINHREPNILLDTMHTNKEYNLKQQADTVMLNWHEIADTDYSHGVIIDNVNGITDDDILEGITTNLDYYFEWDNKKRITYEIPPKVK